MTLYFWSIEDTEFAAVTDPVVRFKDGNHGAITDSAFDLFNMNMQGDVVFRHGGDPAFLQSAKNFTDSGTSVTATLGATATSGNLLVVSVLVDETAGTRTLTTPSGYKSLGGNTVHGSMRLNSYVKIATGSETNVVVAVSAATEVAVIITEWDGFSNYFLRDIAQTDTGNSASADFTTSSVMAEQLELLLGVIGVRTTVSAPTNGYAIRDEQTTASMRLALVDQVVANGLTFDADYSVTLGASGNWIARIMTISPQQTMLKIDALSGDVFIRNAMMVRMDDLPLDPPANEVRIYVREDPASAGEDELLAMFDDGDVVSLARQFNAVAP